MFRDGSQPYGFNPFTTYQVPLVLSGSAVIELRCSFHGSDGTPGGGGATLAAVATDQLVDQS